MNLADLCRQIGLPRDDLILCRPRPRKSHHQPQTWYLLRDSRVEWVLKFGESQSIASQSIEREGRFLSAAMILSRGSPLRTAIPSLVSTGELSSVAYLLTKFDDRVPAHTWLPRRFAASPKSTISWFTHAMGWLELLQSDQELKQALNIPHDRCVVHGDFHFMNALGRRKPETILDWEDWSVSSAKHRDAVLCTVMPTILSDDPDRRGESFRRNWIDVSQWALMARSLVMRFVDELQFRDALIDTLDSQADRLSQTAPVLAEEFRSYADMIRDAADRWPA